MKRRTGPHLPLKVNQRISANTQEFHYAHSGELTTDVRGIPLGVARVAGRVSDVFLGVGGCGRDTSNDLYVECDVFINGTSCLTTKPKIEKNSGEVASTFNDGTEAVLDTDNNVVQEGDFLSADLTIERTATPTTEISNPSIALIFEPIV